MNSQDLSADECAQLLRHPPLILLDDSRSSGADYSLLFTRPEQIISAYSLDSAKAMLAEIDQATKAGHWIAGWFGYELGHVFEHRLHRLMSGHAPLGCVGVFKAPFQLDKAQLDAALDASAGGSILRGMTSEERLETDHPGFRAQFEAVMGYLAAGDCYQVNLTGQYRFTLRGDPLHLYRRLRARQPSRLGAYLHLDQDRLLSLSPELFFATDQGHIISQPMKGTAPRGLGAASDRQAAVELAEDAKNQAENRMIVDLIRNDLSRLAVAGSVGVEDAFHVEALPSVWQMTSRVHGELRSDHRPSDILRTLFPCGSITGAPKIRAMQIIDELETAPRGPYCGAIGYFAPEGRAAFNVAIRTVALSPDGPQSWQARMGIGSGIVADSTPEREYQEWTSKARFLSARAGPPALFETLRWEAGSGFFLADYHLDRIQASAERFAIAFDRADARQRLDDFAATFKAPLMRIRLMLSASGRLALSARPFDPAPRKAGQAAMIIEQSADSTDLALYHKTLWRARYRRAAAIAEGAGVAVAILANEHGEVTETQNANLFVLTEQGWRTPRLTSGLLDGVLRRALLERAIEAQPIEHLAEERLTIAAIMSSKAVYAGNALAGLWPLRIEKVLQGPPDQGTIDATI